VDAGVLCLISPYVPVRLESTLAGFAIRATPAGDDASHTTARPIRVRALIAAPGTG